MQLRLHERAFSQAKTHVGAALARAAIQLRGQRLLSRTILESSELASVGSVGPRGRRDIQSLNRGGDASSDADFLNKMGIALREAKASRAALMKIRVGKLDHHEQVADRALESEAGQLAAIFATIIRNLKARLAGEKKSDARRRT